MSLVRTSTTRWTWWLLRRGIPLARGMARRDLRAGIPEREEVKGVVVLRRGMIGGGNVGWYYTYLDGGLEVERAGLGVYIEGVTKDRGFMINS